MQSVCTGSRSNTSARVKWEKELSEDDVNMLIEAEPANEGVKNADIRGNVPVKHFMVVECTKKDCLLQP